jgi:subtilase family serine protease
LFKPFDETTECGQLGWYDEQTLDVEAVHAMAPGANIMYVGAQDCGDGLDTAINWIVQTDAASIVSDSWGMDGEDGLGTEYAVESKMFLQAKAEGIGFYFSSGDNGDNKLLQKTATAQPDYPASDANVTAVGGTSLGINANGSYGFETGWGTDVDKVNFGTTPATYASAVPGTFKFGAGGGTSKLVPQPSYQVGAVPDSLAQVNGSLRMRVVPDVAAVADPYTGFAVGETVNGIFTVDPFGGTSLACPLFAGLQALASQGRSVPIGFANPLLYSLPKAAFHDVTAPAHDIALASTDGSEIVTLGRDSSLTTTSGFDNITGRGSPIGPVLIVDESPHAWPKLPVAPPSTRHSIVAAVAAF